MPLEVFQAPATLRDQLIEFQTRQQCYPLAEIEQLCIGIIWLRRCLFIVLPGRVSFVFRYQVC
jgi:hypothetical protein